MAPVTDPANEPAPGDALAAMAEPLRERIIEERIGREEGPSLPLFDDVDIFEELDPGS